ncbi:hypothetical protein CHS0354_031730 [Potamilus streckersoni]|uniref:(3R)-3-hydroxyacyl-CoA dehydrogenase n=1 Tax=Potamilus streckersoni TaxID=2493646 RepID=A0AAE0WB98_9BIVA|nr:hypothetical protein CHS0354_031730 [Potamilus streckersoni]
MLAGRLALVTGGGSGIGRAVCQLLAKEGAGVAVVDLNKEAAQETLDRLPKGNHAFSADVSSSSSVKELLKQIKTSFHMVPSIAVNSAGITKDKMMLKMDEESFNKVINVNLKGTFLVNQAVSQAMLADKVPNGSIINISSIVGKVGNIGQVNYAASKAGVIGLTKTAAKELAGFGIRVNAVLPGFIQTPMTDVLPKNVMEIILQLIPAGKMGQPEDVAEACLFLASDRSRYITGTTIEVTGGLFA